jgi:hypothetical protein
VPPPHGLGLDSLWERISVGVKKILSLVPRQRLRAEVSQGLRFPVYIWGYGLRYFLNLREKIFFLIYFTKLSIMSMKLF